MDNAPALPTTPPPQPPQQKRSIHALQKPVNLTRSLHNRKLFDYLARLGFTYVIRFSGDIRVNAACGESRAAAAWVGKGGRARVLRGASVTACMRKLITILNAIIRDRTTWKTA